MLQVLSRTSYSLRGYTHRKEMRGAIKSGKYYVTLSRFLEYFQISVKMIQSIWMFESIAVYVWGALFQVLKLRPGTCANNFLQRGWTGGAGPLFSSHCFHTFSTSSWKVQKCTSPHVVIQKNPTSNSLLHCLKFSSRDTTWSPKKMPLCRPTGILCCQQSSSPKASWLLGINHKSHSKEKSKSPCGKPLNSLRRWISKKFWKVVSSWRHHRVSHSSFQGNTECLSCTLPNALEVGFNLMRREKVNRLSSRLKTHVMIFEKHTEWHPWLRISWNIQFLKLQIAFSLALPILLSSWSLHMSRICTNINELWLLGHLCFDKQCRCFLKS